MTTQQYQAQPSTLQQGLGLLGTGASLYGAMGRKEGGTIKEYAEGGSVQSYDVGGSVDSDIDDIAEAGGAKGLERILSQTKSPEARKRIIARMREMGIAGASTGSLGRNMAGGGIIAFANEGQVQDPDKMTDEERAEYIKNNPYLQRSAALANFPAATGEFLRKYNPITGSAYSEAVQRFVNESPEDQATRFRKASARKEQAANPTQEVPAVKTATQRKEDNDRDDALASVGQSTKVDYKKAEEILRAAKGSQGGDKGGDKGAPAPASDGTSAGRGAVGLEAIIAENRRLAGLEEGPGAKSAAFMKMLEDREAGKASARDSDRLLRAAKAFAKFGSTAGPIGKVASEALGDFTEGEIVARKEQDKLDIEGARLQAEAEKIQRLEAMGYVKEARAAADKLADRQKDYDIARMQANRPGEFDKMYAVYAQNETDAGRKPTFEGFRKSLSASDETGRLNAIFKADSVLANNTVYMGLANSKKPEDKQKAAQMRKDLIDEYMGAMGATQTAGAGGGNKLRFDKDGKQV
jgi:hypothetical protein